jgi:hypothetical protein
MTMPFEPLGTDEKLDAAVPRERDMDSVMLTGCTGFVMASVLTYALGVWPFFVFPEIYLLRTLGLCALVGLVPSLIAGVIFAKKFGVAGAAGMVGGSLATAIFLYLRLDQVSALRNSNLPGEPQYPGNWAVIIPAVWLLISLGIALALSRKSFEFEKP